MERVEEGAQLSEQPMTGLPVVNDAFRESIGPRAWGLEIAINPAVSMDYLSCTYLRRPLPTLTKPQLFKRFRTPGNTASNVESFFPPLPPVEGLVAEVFPCNRLQRLPGMKADIGFLHYLD